LEVERKIIKPEQFLEYKKIANLDSYVIMLIYAIILQRDSGMSLEEIARNNDWELDDVIYFLGQMFPEGNFNEISETDFLEAIPQIYRDEIATMKDIPIYGKKIDELDEIEEYQKIQENIDELEESQINFLVDYLSNSDLSQIPADMWNDISWLDRMNFENTGANLDMKNWDRGVNYSGSFVGCNLISYDHKLYGSLKDYKPYPLENELEPKQYQAVLDSYRGEESLPLFTYKWFERDSTIIDNNNWIIGKVMNKSENYVPDLWNGLSIEQKNKYSVLFDLAMRKAKENPSDINSLIEMFKTAPIEIWDKYISDVEKIYVDEKNNFKVIDFVKEIWKNSLEDVQDKYFNYFFEKIYQLNDGEVIKLFDNLDESLRENKFNFAIDKYLSSKDYNSLITVGSELYLKYKLQDNLIDKLLSGLAGNSFSYTDKFEQLWRSIEKDVQDKHIEEIMSGFSDNSINMENFWEATNKDVQDKHFEEIKLLFSDKDNMVNFWKTTNKDVQDEHFEEIMLGFSNSTKMEKFWKVTNVEVRAEKYNNVVEMAQNGTPFEKYMKGSAYIEIVDGLGEEKGLEFLKNNMAQFFRYLREKYNCNSSEIDRSKDSEYELKYAKVLLNMDRESGILDSENLNVIIENMPKLGVDLINRVYLSNSKMLSEYANYLIPQIVEMPRKNAVKTVEEVEHVFSQKNLPEFIKIYKYYELVNERKYGKFSEDLEIHKGLRSPVLENVPGEKTLKRVIFSDLMKITMDSNNKSMRDFLNTLIEGNKSYIEFVRNRGDLSKLSHDEIKKLEGYTKTLYTLYENSWLAEADKKGRKKLHLSGNLPRDIVLMAKRYANKVNIANLPDIVLKTYIGPYQELFGGIVTVKQMKEYMDFKLEESDRYHREISKQVPELEPGDLVKGISDHINVLGSIFSNGIRAGEFLGSHSHSDFTPLDTDFGLLGNESGTLGDKISSTLAIGYGDMYVILKNDSKKVEFTRSNFETIDVPENSTADRMANINSKDEIKSRIRVRSNEEYGSKKLEAFQIGEEMQYGVRTGLGITDVDYIVVNNWDNRIGHELAMNGTYVPVYDFKTQEILFTPEKYDEIREQMQGLSYYKTGDFKVASSAYSAQADEIVHQLFPDGKVEMSMSQREAKIKRTAIESAVREVVSGEFDLELLDRLTGDVTNGFVELIDTGSTGRGTNLPGDGDFDFTMKLDRALIEDKEKYKSFKEALRNKLGVESDHPKCSIDEANGNFRYKKVKVDGIDEPLDIDITFMPKNDEIEYSTDMSIRDRLEGLKKSDPDGYKVTIANVVLAKRMLKEAGLYKKSSSEGATKFGGFGGAGVENWILQNGGSFYRAMETFLEAAEKCSNCNELGEEHLEFDKFKKEYPIFDFGQNHMSKKYSHDSFIDGVTSEGVLEMRTKFKEFSQQLKPKADKGLTFDEVGRGTIQGFKQRPGDGIAIGETIEKGVAQLIRNSNSQEL